MGVGGAERNRNKYYVKQSVLLIITVLLLIFLTIPTVRTMLDISNQEKIETARNDAWQQKDGLDMGLKKVRVEMLMSTTAPETKKALKEREAMLTAQLAMVSEQLANIQARFDRVEHAVKELPAEPLLWQLLARFGNILQVALPAVSGTLFVTSWVRRRREKESVDEPESSTSEIPDESPNESPEIVKP